MGSRNAIKLCCVTHCIVLNILKQVRRNFNSLFFQIDFTGFRLKIYFITTFASRDISSFILSPLYFGGLRCQYDASIDPVIFIKGPKTAGANPTVAIFPIVFASPEASPAFCIPTSIAMVLQSRSLILNNLPVQ